MIDKRIDGSPADQLRLRHPRHQLDWSPWFDQELRPVFGSPCSDEGLHQHQLRSLSRSWRNRPWSSGAQRQHCPRATVLFSSEQQTCIRCHHLLEYRFDDRFGGIVRNWFYNNPGKFRRVPMKESLAIHDIPEPCQIWMGIWMSLGRGVQLLPWTSFGRSNR